MSFSITSSPCKSLEDLNENWSPDVGLWHQPGPGHTFAVQGLDKIHQGRFAAYRLLNAAFMKRLDEIDADRVLTALRTLQDLNPDSETFGCLRWYNEDTHVDDTNAAFFIGLPLIFMKSQYNDHLKAEGQAVLTQILVDLRTWFVGAVEKHPRVYYPNKYLGDLVCAWLLLEITGSSEKMSWLSEQMLNAAEYWTKNGWGWAEHLSDGYARVCLEELSALLCLSEKLPAPTKEAYTDLLHQLLAIEDAYGGDPRVPAVRSYAFTNSPNHTNFRDRVRTWLPEELMASKDMFNLGHILNSLNWHDRVKPGKVRNTNVRIDCFNGISANAWLQDDVRIGSLSKFPIMPTAEHNGWGLAWQSFPIALWRPEGDWGFLQWLVEEDDTLKAHPAISWNTAYLNNALSKSISPPIVGQTHALQHEGNVLVLRIMPATDMNWNSASDQYRIINNQGEIAVLSPQGPWSQLVWNIGKRKISIHHVDLMGIRGPELVENDCAGYDWRVTWSNKDMQAPPANELGKHMLIGIWGISADGDIVNAPELLPLETVPMQRNPEQKAYVLKWKWPGADWHVEIDPLSTTPLLAPDRLRQP
jgi:hypothetical protein